MIEDETPRFFNVRHRSRGDDDDAPDSTTILPPAAVSSAILRLSFSWLHSSTNDFEDDKGEEQQRQTPHTLMKVDWGSNPTINSCGLVPRRQRQRDQRMPPPYRQHSPVYSALKLLTDRSRRISSNVEGGEDASGAWLMPRHSRMS